MEETKKFIAALRLSDAVKDGFYKVCDEVNKIADHGMKADCYRLLKEAAKSASIAVGAQDKVIAP